MAIVRDDLISSEVLTISVAGSLLPSVLIDTIPSITFTQGTPGTHDLSQYATTPNGYVAVSYGLTGSLPSGVTFDGDTGLLSYDGVGSANTVSGIILTVNADLASTPITTFTLNSQSTGTNVPFTLGHMFRQGDVPATSNIIADVPQFQAVVRNRWPDGSVKYAVLSGRCDFDGSTSRVVQLSTGSPVTASDVTLSQLVTANPNISVEVGSFGTVTLASVVSSPFKQLLAGPVASEWQYRLPVDSQLTVWMYVRLYAGGAINYMVSVENGYFDYTGATNKVGRVRVLEGATVKYDSNTHVASAGPLDIKHHTRVVCAVNATGKHWYGSTVNEVTPAHNSTYFQRTETVPSWQATSISSSLLNSFTQAYTPYAQCNLPGNGLGGGGDHPSIGWMPRWDASYVVSSDRRAYNGVIVNSLASAAYSYHWRNGATNDIVKFGDFPTTEKPLSSGTSYGGRVFYSGQYGDDWDISHGWLPGYTAYVISGDWWHLEELQFAVKWVHYVMPASSSYRNGSMGRMVRGLQSRGIAWAIRNCAMAASITPDNDPERANYANAVGESIIWLRAYFTNTLGLVTEPDQAAWGDPNGQRTWMSDYVVGTIAWVLDQKILSGDQLTQANAWMLWLGNGLVQRMSAGSNPDGWPWTYQVYSPAVTGVGFPANQTQSNWDANWGDVFERNFGRANGMDLDTGIIKDYNWSTPSNLASWGNKSVFGNGYFEYAMCALAQCVNQNVPGALTAWGRITSASNYNTCRSSLANDPRWGIGVQS